MNFIVKIIPFSIFLFFLTVLSPGDKKAFASTHECLAPISFMEKAARALANESQYDAYYEQGIKNFKPEGRYNQSLRKIFKNYPNSKVMGLHMLLQSMEGYKKILLETNELLKNQDLFNPDFFSSSPYQKFKKHLEEILSKIELNQKALEKNVPFLEKEVDSLLSKLNLPEDDLEDMKFHIIRHNQAKIRYSTGELLISRTKPRFSSEYLYTVKYLENLPLSLKTHLLHFRDNSRFQKDLVLGAQRSSDQQIVLGMGHTNPDTDTVFSSLIGMTYLQAESLLNGTHNRIYMPVVQGSYNEETDYIFDISGIDKNKVLQWEEVSGLTTMQLRKLTPLRESALQFNEETFTEFVSLLDSIRQKRKNFDIYKKDIGKEIYSTFEYKRYMTLLRNLFIHWEENISYIRKILDSENLQGLTDPAPWYNTGIVDDLENSNDLQLMNALKEFYQTEDSGNEMSRFYLERICYNILVGAYPFFHKDIVTTRVERTTANKRLTEIHDILARKLSDKITHLKNFSPEVLAKNGFNYSSRLWTLLLKGKYIDPKGTVLSDRIDFAHFNKSFKYLSRNKRYKLEHLLLQYHEWQNKPHLNVLDLGCSDGITTLNMAEKFSMNENLKDTRFNITGADIALDYYVVTDICRNKAFFDAFGNLRQVTISSALGKEKIYSLATPYSFKQLINVFNNMFDSSNIVDIRKHNVISPEVTKKARDLKNSTLSFIPQNLFAPDTGKTYDAVTVFSTLLGNYSDEQIEAALRILGKTVSPNGGLLMVGGVRMTTKEANYVIYQRKKNRLYLTDLKEQGCGLSPQKQQTLREIDLTEDLGSLKASLPEVSLVKTEEEMMGYIQKNYVKPNYTEGRKNFSKYTFYFFDHIVNENPELKALLANEINIKTSVSADHHIPAFEKHVNDLIKKCQNSLKENPDIPSEAITLNLENLKQVLNQLWDSEPEEWPALLAEIKGLEMGMNGLLHYLRHEKIGMKAQTNFTDLITLVHALDSGRIEKIGATCTKIAENLLRNTPYLLTKDVATSLLSAILSDLKGMESPTTTVRDEKIIEVLMPLAGVKNLEAFYNRQKARASSLKGKNANKIFFEDYKTSYTPEAGLAEREISGFKELEDPQENAAFSKDELAFQLNPYLTGDFKLHEKETPRILTRVLSDLSTLGYITFNRKNGNCKINSAFLSENRETLIRNLFSKNACDPKILEAVYDYLHKITRPLILQGVDIYRDTLNYSKDLHFIGATLIDTNTYDSKFLIIGKQKYEKELELLIENMAASPDIITAVLKSTVLKPYFQNKTSLYECSEKILSFFRHDLLNANILLNQIQSIIRKYPVKTSSLYRMADELYYTLTKEGHAPDHQKLHSLISSVPYVSLKNVQSTVLRSIFTDLMSGLPLRKGQTTTDLTEKLFRELTDQGYVIPQPIDLNEDILTDKFIRTRKEDFKLSKEFETMENKIFELLRNSLITVKYINLPGVLSRKKEVAPPIIKFFKNQNVQTRAAEFAMDAIAENQVRTAA